MPAVRYFVTDLDRSLGFYAKLGFEEAERWGPAFAIVELDGFQLWPAGPGTSASKPMPDGRLPEPGGWNRIVVSPDNFDETVRILTESGAVFRNEPIVGPGGKQVLVEDPDGNPIELFEARD